MVGVKNNFLNNPEAVKKEASPLLNINDKSAKVKEPLRGTKTISIDNVKRKSKDSKAMKEPTNVIREEGKERFEVQASPSSRKALGKHSPKKSPKHKFDPTEFKIGPMCGHSTSMMDDSDEVELKKSFNPLESPTSVRRSSSP
jgi:hypothetical protein